ncbi:hypothetical protein [Mycolicibacterium brumae]|nr:hypothetical protein [Mycolicibacterium brumae]MCV7192206.1 hypothetical protein [Mycolicibacterium brumae]UWW07031.1 hypothetical protein L2Z93_000017 [Mycolicibacterium brumae]
MSGKAMWAGVLIAATGLLLAGAPAAYAGPDQQNSDQQCPAEQQTADGQCAQDDTANKVIDQVQDGVDQAKDAAEQAQKQAQQQQDNRPIPEVGYLYNLYGGGTVCLHTYDVTVPPGATPVTPVTTC